MQVIAPPRFGPDEYGTQLGNTEFWLPYAEAALQRSGHPAEELASGFPGSYPTLVGDTVVVKLFGHFGDWRQSFAVELEANRAIEGSDRIRAPRVLATGELFPGQPDNWPYLVMERLRGVAWRDAKLDQAAQLTIARVLGEQLRAVHQLRPRLTEAGAAGFGADWLTHQQDGIVERYRHWGCLPDHLIDQLQSYLADFAPGDSSLVHGDVTEDHVFVADGGFVGLIDWGDAMVTDPHYELAALQLGTFAGDRRLLAAFLDGYGWPVDDGFVRRAMQVALLHRFNVFDGFRAQARAAVDLDDLARRIWEPASGRSGTPS